MPNSQFRIAGLPKSTKRYLARTQATTDAAEVTQATQVAALRTLANEMKGDFNATLTQLDADAGVTDTTYSSGHSVAAPNA